MSTLAHQLVTAGGDTKPAQWALFLHGMLGTGSNWRSFAKKVVTANPAWGAVLVDLRLHGGSREGFGPPHTIEAAANDLVHLEGALEGPVRGIVGHSLGAKVSMAYAKAKGAELHRAVFVDGMPGERPDARGSEYTMHVLGLMKARNARVFSSRDEFIASLTGEGIKRDMALWLAMNLRSQGDHRDAGYALGLDLPGLEGLLDDYFTLDLWPLFESVPAGVRWDAIVGGQSAVFLPEERERLMKCAAGSSGALRVHVIEKAGHWVHVDAPAETEAVLREVFAPSDSAT